MSLAKKRKKAELDFARKTLAKREQRCTLEVTESIKDALSRFRRDDEDMPQRDILNIPLAIEAAQRLLRDGAPPIARLVSSGSPDHNTREGIAFVLANPGRRHRPPVDRSLLMRVYRYQSLGAKTDYSVASDASPANGPKGYVPVPRCTCSADDLTALDALMESGTKEEKVKAERIAKDCAKGGGILEGSKRRRR